MSTYPASPREAVERLQTLARELVQPSTRDAARVQLEALATACAGRPESAPLRLAEIDVEIGSAHERLRLLLLPSIFAPEAWAYTFLEGLLKLPLDEYAGKSLVEVGTGSGWICVALARFTQLEQIIGVDLNPHAPAVGVCNAYLNLDDKDAARLSFAPSDLLRAIEAPRQLDFVVGCIPQVLRGQAPDGPLDDEQALHDLSNYCALQNVYEDHFGLGLIAKLLDEVPERLAPGGRVLLNLAGRPGRAIIERMFSRRGFSTRLLVAQRVRQAGDTDIEPLVELEERTRRSFEFFVEAHSAEPIRAATALGWLRAGHPIWHEVAVWEARLRLPRETLALREGLRALGLPNLLAELDLGDTSQEQLDFVAALARRIHERRELPYAHEAGDASFRKLVASYLQRFFGLTLGEDEIFVGPEREQTIHSILQATCDPGDEILVSRNVEATYAKALRKAGVTAIVTNDTLREVKRLLGAFEVKMVLLAVEPSERSNLAALRDILEEARRRGILVVLDESAFFTITSEVAPRTLFEFLAREPRSDNLVVLYGLIKNAVWPDLELSLLLPTPRALFADLEIAAETTYSRISTIAQWFYEKIFAELLAFRISFETPAPRAESAVPARLPRSARIRRLAAAPAFAPKIFRADDPRLVRLDYGENEGPIPEPLAEGLLAAFASPRDADGGAHGLEEALRAFLLETRGARYGDGELVLAPGVWPLVHDLGIALARRFSRRPRVFVATPCYGLLPPTLEAAGVDVEAAPLETLLARRSPAPDAVFITQPANPLGAYLPREELIDLASYCIEARCLLVSDEIFGLVNLSNPAAETVASPVTLDQAVPGIEQRTVILGGLSKEFAAGGIRIGFLASSDRALCQLVRDAALGKLQLATARAAAHLYGAYLRSASGKLVHAERHRTLRAYLKAMRRELADKRQLLASAFPSEPSGDARELGGLFLAPVLDGWLGKRASGTRLIAENLPQVLYAATGVVVNSGAWCHDERRIRAVFSLPRPQLEAAVRAVRAFADTLA